MNYRQGFTIVELLIVIVVIAILAAITVVAYNGIQNRAYDSTVQSDLRNAYMKIVAYRETDGNGIFPDADDTELGKAGITASKNAYEAGGNFLYCFVGRSLPTGAILLVAKSKSGKVFYYSTTAGAKQYTGSNDIGGFAALCNELLPATGITSASARYGALSGGTWRSWVGGS